MLVRDRTVLIAGLVQKTLDTARGLQRALQRAVGLFFFLLCSTVLCYRIICTVFDFHSFALGLQVWPYPPVLIYALCCLAAASSFLSFSGTPEAALTGCDALPGT